MTSDRSDSSTPRHLAGDLLEEEGMAPDEPESVTRSCGAVLDRLYEKLRPLVGNGGFETLLARATFVSARRYPHVGELPIARSRPPTSQELMTILQGPDGESAAEIAQTLIAELLSFFVRLVGGQLTLVLLRDLWPDVASSYDAAELEDSASSHPTKGEG